MVDTAAVPLVVYANDPLCGWCFAIGPEIDAARRRLGSRVRWHVTCGGLVVGDRVRAIAFDRDYLRAGLAEVERVSGRTPGPAYYTDVLDPGEWVSSSEPACRAVLIARELAGDRAIDFSHRLTEALYLHGRLPDHVDTLSAVARSIDVDDQELIDRWAGPDAAAITQLEFAEARRRGITTYPSLFLDVDGHLEPLLTGYATHLEIEATIRDSLEVPA